MRTKWSHFFFHKWQNCLLFPLTSTACTQLIWFPFSTGGIFLEGTARLLVEIPCDTKIYRTGALFLKWSWLAQNCVLLLRFLPIFHLRDLILESDKLFWSLYSWVWFQPVEVFFLAISWKETRPTTKTARGPAAMINAVANNSTIAKPLSSLKRKWAHQSWNRTWGELTHSEILMALVITQMHLKTSVKVQNY